MAAFLLVLRTELNSVARLSALTDSILSVIDLRLASYHSDTSRVEVDDARPALEELEVALAGLGRLDVRARGGRKDSRGHAAEEILLVETTAKTPVEEAARVDPLELVANDTLGLHAAGAVVKVGELNGDLRVDRQELLLADRHLLLELVGLLLRKVGCHLLLKRGVDGVQASHGLELLVLAVLDTDNALGLEHTTASIDIGVHLHGLGVNGGVDDDPRTATKLTEGRNVDKDGLLELDEGVDDVGTVLQNLVVHVALTTRETSPVGEDHERQLLTVVEVVDGLGSLEGRVGVPHTTGLVRHLLDRIGVGGIGRGDVLDRAGLDRDDTHGDATETSTANNNGASPAAEGLDEGVLVEQTGLEVTLLRGATTNHPSDVVRLLLGRGVDDVAVPDIRAGADGDGAAALLGDKGHPLDNLGDTIKVVGTSHVGDTVAVHDLSTTKLQVGGVDLTAKNVVQRRGTSEDDGLALDLDGTLAETNKVGTDTNGTASHQGDGENIVVGLAGGTGNETGAPQALDTKTVLSADNGNDLVALLAILGYDLSDDILGEALLGLVVEVEVLEAVVLLAGVVPRDLEVGHELVGDTQTSTGVGRQVDARDAKLAGKLGALVKVVVLLGAEATNHVRDIVGNDNELATLGVLGGLGVEDPTDHTAGVGTGLAVDLLEGVLVVQDELGVGDALARLGLLSADGAVLLDRLGPAVLDGLAEQLGEVVHVLGTHQMSLVTLGLQRVLGRVRGRDRQQMHRALLLGTTDAVENPLALLGLALGVDVDVNNVSRGVGDDDTQGVGDASLGVGADDADLDLGNTQAPSTGSEAVEEALQTALDLLGVQLEHRGEVDEDLVQIRVVVANDFEGVKDVVDDTVSLGDQVLGGGDLITETTGTNDGTGKVALVAVDGLADTLVNVDVLVLGEDGLDVELGQSAELELEGKSGLAVTNAVILDVLGATERVVSRVGTVVAATDEGDATDVAVQEILLELLNDGDNARENLLITLALGVADGDIDDSRELIRVNLGRGGLALAAQVGDKTGGAALSRLVRESEGLEGLAEQVLGIVEVLDGHDHTLAVGLRVPLVVEVGHVADGVNALEVKRAAARAGRGGRRRSRRLQRQAVLALANLAQSEVPGNEKRRIALVRVVLDLLQDVGTVGTTDVDLEGSNRNVGVLVGKEKGQDVEDGVLGVDDLLDDLEARLAVVPRSLTVA
ncbi:hypothetical protein ColKHC_14217 [Colletotrichum higginsianum]|nr:hypothetical protein ColKHC_14217 [Colletotrichum higginsianum]